jgi:hypothetical protein
VSENAQTQLLVAKGQLEAIQKATNIAIANVINALKTVSSQGN